jgi:hypothetical protein
MHPQLQAIVDDLHSARARFERIAAATPDARWSQRAEPAGWSVAECIAHLNLTARAMQPLLEDALKRARAAGGPPVTSYRRSVLGAILGASVGPMLGWGKTRFGRMRTPLPFIPGSQLDRAAVTKEFLDHLASHERAIRESDGLAIDGVKIESPFRRGTYYDAFSGWIVVARHLHRHLAQAERVWG